MIKYLKEDAWKVIEEGFHPEYQRSSESVFSIGNGHFGQRANFEENYGADSLQGSYVAGIYYPDKTRVGWWKNGYPEYFAKVLNSTNWIGIRVVIDGEELDLAQAKVISFQRELDMRRGLLSRIFVAELSNGNQVKVNAERFCSMADNECAAIRYSLKMVKGDAAKVEIRSYLDAQVVNEDSNWEAGFWNALDSHASAELMYVGAQTKKTEFELGVAAKTTISHDSQFETLTEQFYAEQAFDLAIAEGRTVTVEKFVGLVNSMNYKSEELRSAAEKAAERGTKAGYEAMRSAQAKAWEVIWSTADIQIDGDIAAQQGIRFNIFHLNQTYTGEDARLNIGPKGFTGEKYGGSTYWDTEAYCLPFYLNTHNQRVGRQLLVYRYEQLQKAIENAEKLGFTNGAALYPMVTMNGEECHNEWEITFEEIHRNGAIAYGICNYVRHTGDRAYLAEYGFDVLLGIARFWEQRFNWSEDKQAYVMLGVTGPNEYENNVNNNWYTNYIARWCMTYTLKVILFLKENHASAYADKKVQWNFDEEKETKQWASIVENTYLPQMKGSEIVLQQDGFLDKELLLVSDLKDEERPINQHWSWDRILRSVFIKQADVLQGFYFFEEHFSNEQLEANFDFYEPRTVHESSLSPCVHVVLAAKLGREEKAYEMYLRTARLDLDDYNHEAYQGLHITSMAGTWMAVVEGFGGLRVKSGELHLNPMLPSQWSSYSFNIKFRDSDLKVTVDKDGTKITRLKGDLDQVKVNGESIALA
ncbi:MAG: family 65 glycosyl hydrolase domain-containing protein [Flavobacteriales bacterium]|nr:family 65 glycosyl hydrolase domain-containing protein [Flavobacteriales bacterium]